MVEVCALTGRNEALPNIIETTNRSKPRQTARTPRFDAHPRINMGFSFFDRLVPK
jgi:hypothetical protein